jgi:hypothetical protein
MVISFSIEVHYFHKIVQLNSKKKRKDVHNTPWGANSGYLDTIITGWQRLKSSRLSQPLAISCTE